jgi:hypothetical protein
MNKFEQDKETIEQAKQLIESVRNTLSQYDDRFIDLSQALGYLDSCIHTISLVIKNGHLKNVRVIYGEISPRGDKGN